jgi:ketosteroid isomerase-like protein
MRVQDRAVGPMRDEAGAADPAGDIASARATVVAYHAAIDRSRATAALPLFAEDAHFEAKGEVLQGHAEIGGFLSYREAQRDRHTVHVIANETAEHVGADEVELSAFVLLHVRRPDGGYALERVLDTVHRVRRTDGGWRIARRSSRPLHEPSEHARELP